MKLFAYLICGSIALAFGGVALLHLNEYNILSTDLWSLAVRASIYAPASLLESAISADDANFFRGILITVVGVLLAIVFSMFLSLSWMWSSIRSKVKRRRSSKGSWTPREPKKSATIKSKKKVASTPKSRRPIGDILGGVTGKFNLKKHLPQKKFIDRDANLEGDSSDKVSLFQSLKEVLLSIGKQKNKTLVIKSGNKEEAVIEVVDDSIFVADLKEWYGGLKDTPKGDQEKIKEAAELVERASKRARAKVLEEDAMNGEFNLRMMDAWASKESKSPVAPEGHGDFEKDELTISDDVFARAISEITEQSVETQEFGGGEDDLDEDYDDEDDDFVINDIDLQGVEEGRKSDDEGDDFTGDILEEIDSDSEGEVGEILGDEGSNLTSIKTVGQLFAFEELAARVSNSEVEWEEDFYEPEGRRQFVNELFETLSSSVVSEASEIEDISDFDVGENEREVNWLRENMEDLADLREALLEAVSPDESRVSEDDFDESLLDEEFSAKDGVEEVDSHTTESEPEVGEVTGNVAEESVNSLSGEASDDNLVDGAPTDRSSEIEAEEEEPQLDVLLIDVSLGDLLEVERSGDLIDKWGYVVKGAGAAEAKISHSVLVKEGLTRRVVGISHIVAKWRNKEGDDSRRLNIILRYVPDGEWHLVADDHHENGVRVVDNDQGFVQVSKELLQQPEIRDGVVVIHFYGPGAPADAEVEAGDLIITSETLDVDRVRDKMDGR